MRIVLLTSDMLNGEHKLIYASINLELNEIKIYVQTYVSSYF